MFDWKSPSLSDLSKIKNAAEINNQFGNEMCAANLLLYRKKYNTQIAFFDNMLFRRYSIDNQIVYGIPLALESIASEITKNQKILDGIDLLISENLEKGSIDFAYVYENDLKLLKSKYKHKVKEKIQEDSFDYIYLRENLAVLEGSKYQKKRNHISRFLRSFPQGCFQALSKENVGYAWEVEQLWLEAANNQGESSKSLNQEYSIIKEALENFEVLNLFGGIVFVDEKPVAMTVASSLNSKIMDIHFEKAIMPYAFEGAYSFINREFAKTQNTLFFNREEDLGISGLRKAKMSYYPTEILKKWSAKIEF